MTLTSLLRAVPLCALFATTLACDPQRGSPQSTVSEAGTPATDDALALKNLEIASYPELSSQLSPLRTSIANTALALRRDSGTLAADSALLRLRAELEMNVAEVVKQFNDQKFQADVWPSGAFGLVRSRQGARPQRQATQEELARADSLTELLEAHGVWVRRSEGDSYFALHLPLLLTRVGPFLTVGMRDFLAMEAEEQRRPAADDAALAISLEELTERSLWAERFVESYPDALLVQQARKKYSEYLRLYLDGLDNTPAFERSSGRVRPQLVEHMADFAQKHDSTKSGQLVARYLDLLKSNNYKRSARSDALVSQLP